MAGQSDDWEISPEAQPRPEDYAYDLDRALASVVALSAKVPADAFTATTLGVERAGNGVVIRSDGLVLTIGYLVTEAEEITLATADGLTVAGHVLGYDQSSGLGLVQALDPLGLPALAMGAAARAPVGQPVVIGGAGGRSRSVAARILAKQEFTGYWEYLLDEAVFTGPAHPFWGGAAMIGPAGDLLGVGSLQVQQRGPNGRPLALNMMVPIDLLPPVFDDLLVGKPSVPARPWLGVYAQEQDDRIVLIGFAGEGPARRAGLKEGDVVVAVAGEPVATLAEFYRALWALGSAGVAAPLTLDREGDVFDVEVTTSDRRRYLKTARFH